MPVTGSQPSLQDQRALGQLILRFLIKANSKRRRPLVEFLFRELESDSDKTVPLTTAEVLEGFPKAGTVTNLRALKTRLSDDLDKFFNDLEGRNQKWCVYFEDGDYRPRFRLNIPRPKGVDYLAQFWAPHRESVYPTQILYPEPTFYQDSHNTYLRNPEANGLNGSAHFSYLLDKEYPEELYHSKLETTHSYVPSGTVGALLHLVTQFHRWGQEIEPQPFLPDATVSEQANCQGRSESFPPWRSKRVPPKRLIGPVR